jgi:hypothetical protein
LEEAEKRIGFCVWGIEEKRTGEMLPESAV